MVDMIYMKSNKNKVNGGYDLKLGCCNIWDFIHIWLTQINRYNKVTRVLREKGGF